MSQHSQRQPDDSALQSLWESDPSFSPQNTDFTSMDTSIDFEPFLRDPIDLSILNLGLEVQMPSSYGVNEPQRSTFHGESEPLGPNLSQHDQSVQADRHVDRTLMRHRRGRGPALDWEAQKDTIEDFYLKQNMTLGATIREMGKKGFKASESAYKKKFKEWEWFKNKKNKAQQRQEELDGSTHSVFEVTHIPGHMYNHPVQEDTNREVEIPAGAPSGIIYSTLQESAGSVGQRSGSRTLPLTEFTWNDIEDDAGSCEAVGSGSASQGPNHFPA